MRLKLCIVFFIFCFSSSNFACDKLNLVEINTSINPNSQLEQSLVSCKMLPNDKTKSIIVLPLIQSKGDDFTHYDLSIIQLDNTTKQIISQTLINHALTADAIGIDSINIDTANYQLNKTIRAFGIKVQYSNRSSLNPFSETKLSLYMNDNNKIIPLLTGLTIDKSLTDLQEQCLGNTQVHHFLLAIAKTNHNNFNDIILKETSFTETLQKTKKDCITKKGKPSSKSYTLIFDGKTYIIPKELQN